MGWFTKQNILYALKYWAEQLTEDRLNTWLSTYNLTNTKPKTVAIIMAGNIPLVGFHDFLSVLLSGHAALVKLSSNVKYLLPFLANYLITVEPLFKERIVFTESKIKNYQAAIATGSNNTARYFEYYFKNIPSIIRKNRTSVAVLNGHETATQLQAFSEDIFRYYGLGCRSVSKLFVPENYNFDAFFKAVYHWHPVINETKYANNYDYNKAVYLMNLEPLLENGFLILKQDNGYHSPIATLFYEHYTTIKTVLPKLYNDKIQCVVSESHIPDTVNFGQSQQPALNDYADGIDVVDFLLKI